MDVMGGGLMADLAKYEELDDAQEQIEQLQVELRRFKTELSDVEITADLQVTVDSFLKFADFFFDGLFADWAVLDHINQAQSRVENTKGQIKRVLALLKKMREDIDVQIADEKESRSSLRWKPNCRFGVSVYETKIPKDFGCRYSFHKSYSYQLCAIEYDGFFSEQPPLHFVFHL